VHDDYEEAFYVLAEPIDYLIGGTWTRAPTGSAVFIPPGRGTASQSRPEPARHLAIASAAEAMTMIEELAQTPPGQQPAFSPATAHTSPNRNSCDVAVPDWLSTSRGAGDIADLAGVGGDAVPAHGA
jgi:hypothetical protein